MKKERVEKNKNELKKKKYTPPEIQEHSTIDKAKGCDYYVSRYHSVYGVYYY